MQAENNAQLTARVQDITAQQTAAIQDTIKMYQFTQSPVAKSMVFHQLAYMLSLFGTMQNQAVKKHSAGLLKYRPKQDVTISTLGDGAHVKTAEIATSTEDLEDLNQLLKKQFSTIVEGVERLPLSDGEKDTFVVIKDIHRKEYDATQRLLESEVQARKRLAQSETRDLAAIQAAQQKALQTRQQKTVETSTESQVTSNQMQLLFERLHAYQNKLQELLRERDIKHVYDYDGQQWQDLWVQLPEEIQAFNDELSVRTIMGYLEGLLLADKDRVSTKLHTLSEKSTYNLLQLLQNVQQIKKQRVYKLLELLKQVSLNPSKGMIKA